LDTNFGVLKMTVNIKIALITGASSGLGENLTRELIQKGWCVIGVARTKAKLDALHQELGEKFYPVVCDVAKKKDIQKTSSLLKESGMIPSLFFLNAGMGDLEGDTFDVKMHERIFDVNYFGALHWLEEWLETTKQNGATFVAISSILVLHPTPGASAYCASKAALKACFESLKMHYLNTPVKFITVAPGPMETAMLKSDKPVPGVWTPGKAAKYILNKVFKGKQNIIFPLFYRILFNVLAFLPLKITSKILK
jgi:3-hydroxy acid dehydrogenase/malonic semialdehyde reductase